MHGKLPRSYETLADIFFHKEFIFSCLFLFIFSLGRIESDLFNIVCD